MSGSSGMCTSDIYAKTSLRGRCHFDPARCWAVRGPIRGRPIVEALAELFQELRKLPSQLLSCFSTC